MAEPHLVKIHNGFKRYVAHFDAYTGKMVYHRRLSKDCRKIFWKWETGNIWKTIT